ncbi:MAG: RnfABCDGE type electron transport complex subunit G [Oscillospiraceae bacterium]|nr:RnfABCDGE type electron transport complex subunit G [Oscillospiraceae bacterium]
MRKQNTALYILKLALTLLVITAAVAAALAGVNALTAPRIAAITEQKTKAAIEKVLPGGGEMLENYTDETGLVTAVYASESGYAVQVAPSGFDGEILMMVGVDKDGNVLGIDIISHTETAGLGAVAAADSAKGEAFRSQFVGLGDGLAVEKDGGQIDSLTSATITSRAVVTGVNAAVECVKNLG